MNDVIFITYTVLHLFFPVVSLQGPQSWLPPHGGAENQANFVSEISSDRTTRRRETANGLHTQRNARGKTTQIESNSHILLLYNISFESWNAGKFSSVHEHNYECSEIKINSIRFKYDSSLVNYDPL